MRMIFILSAGGLPVIPSSVLNAEWITIVGGQQQGDTPAVYAFPPIDNVPASPACHMVKSILALAEYHSRVRESGCPDCEESLELIEFVLQQTITNPEKIRLFKHAISAAEQLHGSGAVSKDDLEYEDPWRPHGV